jgi:hypothetical protein
MGDELFRFLLGRLGIALSILDLSVDLRLHALPLLFSISLGLFAFAFHELGGDLLSLGNPLLDAPSRLPFRRRHAGATTFADLLSAVGALLGLPRGLDGLLLGFPSTLEGIPRAPHPNRVLADGNGVSHGCAQPPPLVASARRS